jgi:hypothetical protein
VHRVAGPWSPTTHRLLESPVERAEDGPLLQLPDLASLAGCEIDEDDRRGMSWSSQYS